MSIRVRYKKLKNGVKSAFLDIYHQGDRRYEFLDIQVHRNDPEKKQKEKFIEQIRSQRELELYQIDFGIVPNHRQNVDFIEYFQNFIELYVGKDDRLVRYALNKFKIMVGRDRFPITSLTKKVCSDYARFLKNPANGLSGETPYNYFMKFKRVIKEAILEGIIRYNPSEGIIVRRKTNQLKKNVLSAEELGMLAKTKCSNPEIKRAFLFACFTGLGRAEIVKLTWNNIQNNRLIIYRQKSKEQVINELHPVALKLLENGDKAKKNGFLFNLPTEQAIGYILKKWVKKAGISKHISFYCGRHTFGTQLLLNGANLKTVADCLGHSNTTHTLKYLNYVDELKDEAIRNLPNIDVELT